MSTATLPLTPAAPSRFAGVQAVIRTIGNVALILLGFAIPLSTSGAEILVGVAGFCWILSGDCLSLAGDVRRNRVVALSLGLFGLLLAGASYGPGNAHDIIKTLSKYRELLYVPMFVPAFTDEQLRTWSLRAFLAGVITMVGLSYFEWLSGIDIGHLSATDYVIYKDRICHAFLVAFAMYVLAHQAWVEPRGRWWRVAFIPVGVFNILFLVQGRTGHLIMSLLVLLFTFQHARFRGLALGLALLMGFWVGVYRFSPVVQQRIHSTVGQFRDKFGPEQKRNDDARLEFYEYSLKIIRQTPLMGTGTGGFLHAYREIARINGVPVTEDPHSEYLLLAVQLGVWGPLALLTLLGGSWLTSYRLPLTEQQLAQGLLMTIAAGCLVNSLMYGFTGGLLFGYFAAWSFAALPRKQQTPVESLIRPERPIRAAA